ncbi:oligosaccharide flippase family protein [uncultured Pluralibacter sp.]|uniref:oligosaccharide flippase family protein n=1 Tax=uncultured Pluralibacter sp. TaxID=1490864 RepID=UPI00262FD9AB|nr:oligosaccharide flippase family protein [uncultured Pluralibacter sp.]
MNKQTLINTLWMFVEKIVLVAGFFLIGAWLARYLGPGLTGQLTYLIAVYQVVQVIAKWGSESTLFRRVSKNPRSGSRCLQATGHSRVVILLLLACPIEIYFYCAKDETFFILSAAVAASALFSTLDVYAVYYNARLMSKYNTVINSYGLITTLALRTAVVTLMLKPLWLVLPIVVNSALPCLLRRRKYLRNHAVTLAEGDIKHYRRYFLHSGKHLVFSSLSIALYTQSQNFFIYHYAGSVQLGIYAVATVLATGTGALINPFITSCYASIYAETDSGRAKKRVGALLRWVTVLAATLNIMVIIASGFLIPKLYGAEFTLAREPLMILSIAATLSFMGSVTYRYIMHHSGFYYLSIKTVFSLVFSIAITGYLVKEYGITGAAWAAVTTELVSLTVLNYFFKQRAVLKMHLFTLRGR